MLKRALDIQEDGLEQAAWEHLSHRWHRIHDRYSPYVPQFWQAAKAPGSIPFTKVFPQPLMSPGGQPILQTRPRQLQHWVFTHIALGG
jgi:hypothetical protein